MSRATIGLLVGPATVATLSAVLIAGLDPRTAQPDAGPVPAQPPVEIAPEPHVPRWPAPGSPAAGLPPEPDSLQWEPAAPALPKLGLVGVSDDGRMLATAHWKAEWERGPSGLCLWNLETGERRHVPIKKPGEPSWLTVGFSPDGKSMAVRFSGHLSLWGVGGDKPKAEIDPGDWRESRRLPVFSPDGAAVALGGSELLGFEGDGLTRQYFGGPAIAEGFTYSTPTWSPDGRWIAALTQTTSHLCVWDTRSGEVAWKTPKLGHAHGSADVRFSADSGRVLVIDWGAGSVTEWDNTTRKVVREGKVPPAGSGGRDASADGSRLAWVNGHGGRTRSGSITVADAGGTELRRIRSPVSIASIRLSGNGKRLAATGDDDSLRVYDTENGTVVRTIHDGWSAALHVAYREGGAVIRSTHADHSIREQESATGKPLRITRLPLPEDEYLVAISPDARLWATVTGGASFGCGTPTGDARGCGARRSFRSRCETPTGTGLPEPNGYLNRISRP